MAAQGTRASSRCSSSPKVIRDLKLFSVLDDDQKDDLLIPAIHDEPGLPADP